MHIIGTCKMGETNFTFRVDEKLKAEFTAAARARDRAGSQLLRDFMRDFVQHSADEAAYDQWFRQQVKIGLDDATAGRTTPRDQVEAEFSARRRRARASLGNT